MVRLDTAQPSRFPFMRASIVCRRAAVDGCPMSDGDELCRAGMPAHRRRLACAVEPARHPDHAELAERPLALLLALLTFLWAAHTLVVGSSAAGLRLLGSRFAAGGMLAVAATVACVVAIAVGRRRSRSSERDASLRDDEPRIARRLGRVFIVSGVIATAAITGLCVAVPIMAYDALAYRLPAAAGWLDAGRVAWLATDDPVRNGYPLGLEAVGALVTAAIGSTALDAAVAIALVLAGALAIRALARACGARPWLASAASGIYLLVPINLLNAPSGYVDAAFGGAVVALVALGALWSGGAAPRTALAAGTGMAAALVLAIKGTGLAFVVVVLVALAWRLWRRRTGRAHDVALAGVLGASGLFWILRNMWHTGNPVFPVQVSVAGQVLFAGTGSLAEVLDYAHNRPPALSALPEVARIALTWLQVRGPATGFDDRWAGLGWAWPLVAVPAIIAYAVGALRTRGRRDDVSFALLVTTICFALQPERWWSRYTVWVWGVGAVATALGAERWLRAGWTRAATVALAAVAALVLVEASFALAHVIGVPVVAADELRRGQFAVSHFTSVREASTRLSWLAPGFWDLGLDRSRDVCRTEWTPHTDDALVDGLFAQLVPRPRVHVVADEHRDWPAVRADWLAAHCDALLVLRGSPILESARRDTSVRVQSAAAFDPLWLIRRVPEELPP